MSQSPLAQVDVRSGTGTVCVRRQGAPSRSRAHPRVSASSREFPEHLVFLENYDMHLGALLTRGCDVWLNNPVRPKEASGTSGMKAAANGVLNLSILDGWWDEGCEHGVNGWGVGAPPEGEDADDHDYQVLRDLLENEVIPTYVERPDSWREMMRQSIVGSEVRFSADRCVQRYFSELYGPA